jgi:hypothetical protein
MEVTVFLEDIVIARGRWERIGERLGGTVRTRAVFGGMPWGVWIAAFMMQGYTARIGTAGASFAGATGR